MTDNYFYEKVIKTDVQKSRLKLYTLIAGCVLLFVAFEYLILIYLKYPSALVIGAAIPALVFFILHKYTKAETEISVAGGFFTFCIIYGGKKRKVRFETPLKSFAYIAPHEEKYLSSALRMNIDKIFYAIPEINDPQNEMIAVFDLLGQKKSGKDREIKRGLFIFQSDEKLTRILKINNYHNFAR